MFAFCRSRFMALSRPPRLGPDTAYLLLYVDDIILTASSTSLLQRIISLLHAEFAMTDLGPLNYFLGISATRTTSGIFLSQTKYATEILEQAQMLNCNPCRTPIDTEKKLGPEGSPVTDPTLYRSLAGSLQYLTFTRPDLSYAVQQLCLYMHDPREPHLNAMKRVLRYLRGTTDLGLQLFRSTTSQLIAYSDADWAGCPATRRSTSGYCVFLGDNLLTWSSKRQDTLSHSSAEAEYRGVANAVAETSWIHNLFRELHTPLFTATLVYCDNFNAVYMSANPVQHQRTKHIEIDIHFVHDKVAAGHVRVLHGQILADFIVERPKEDDPGTAMEVEEELLEPWILFTDGSSCADSSRARLILKNPEGAEFTYTLRFRFEATNNEAEYEALIAGLRIAEEMGVKIFSIKQVPRSEKKADALSKITSTSFAHLSKQVLVEELKEKSINELEVLAVVEEDGNTWMTLIYEYITEETLPAEVNKARAGRRKSQWFSFAGSKVLYKKNHFSYPSGYVRQDYRKLGYLVFKALRDLKTSVRFANSPTAMLKLAKVLLT
ncbi:ribonuclease H-like domain-containing protein [Tanacetum coccineum]